MPGPTPVERKSVGPSSGSSDLRDANLAEANISRTNLYMAILSRADRTGADLRRTDLTRAIGISPSYDERRALVINVQFVSAEDGSIDNRFQARVHLQPQEEAHHGVPYEHVPKNARCRSAATQP